MITNQAKVFNSIVITNIDKIEELLLILTCYINIHKTLSQNEIDFIWSLQNRINHWGRNALIIDRDWDKLVEIEKKLRIINV
jgi:hypothetical protein